MPTITPHLWFDTEAQEAAQLYTATFPGSAVTDVTTIHDTPSGDVDLVSFTLCGQPFMAINAGPFFAFNPSISFLVSCVTPEEVDTLWAALAPGGTPLMELGAYPFSSRYGWTTDRYGLSWQLMYDRAGSASQRIAPALLFVGDVAGRAADAIEHYTSVFPDSAVVAVERWAAGEGPELPGTIKHARFSLAGHGFAAMDSALGHDFGFNEAISLMVECESQAEIDHYAESLSAVPEAEDCGWLKDRFGVSWQVAPRRLTELLRAGSDEQRKRVTQSFLAMKRLDLAELERAYAGTSAPSPG